MMPPKRTNRRHLLGVTLDDYDAMLGRQGGGCALCGRPPKVRRLDTDHDHSTGDVRGLLCVRCNRALPSWVTPGWLWLALEYLTGADPYLQRADTADTVMPVEVRRCGYCGRVAPEGATCPGHADLTDLDPSRSSLLT